jgi:signal transduction histidine kinase
MTTDLVDRLAAHKTLGKAPRKELEWVAAHGSLRQLNTGDVLSSKNAPVDSLHILLAGRVAIYIDRGAGLSKMVEWGGGDVTGILPYSRLVSPPGDSVAQEPTTLLSVHQVCFPDLIRECHEITSILVHSMVDRVRVFRADDLINEKMVSLGKLSAGLAHELNNPASAIERSAALLEDLLDEAERATRALGAAHLTDGQLEAVDRIRASCLATRMVGVLSPIEHAEREEAIADWLADRGLDVAVAEALADTPVSFESLDEVARAVNGPALNAVLRWAASGCSVRRLASEIQDAATRISGLVLAIKGYTHMDQATVAEPVDLVQGLENTVTVLKSKARKKSASVVVDVEPGLPRVRGFVSELNQIWSNLIDNALDAIPKSGRVEVVAKREGAHVTVRVVDNGAGIPEDIQGRIFEPFYTTKPMGEGTGMGLDFVRRLVLHNEGNVAFDSRPGRTEFRVALPVADDAAVEIKS